MPSGLTLALLLILVGPATLGIINPGLQPSDLYNRYDVVLNLKVVSSDAEKQTAVLEVVRVCKGDFAPKTISLAVSGSEVTAAFGLLGQPGSVIVAYCGQKGRKPADKLCFYPGSGRWQIGTVDARDPSRWLWTEDIDPAVDGTGMSGTFNGGTERLAEMMEDKLADRYFFPATPNFQFGNDIVLGRFAQPIGGVALYDLDGDGKPDIYACSAGGDRIYRQTGTLDFVDATTALGLTGMRNPSVGIADVDGDSRPDLLAGAVILLAEGDGAGRRFRAAELLPTSAAERLKCATFVEVNGDGYPDVVVSTLDGGLHAYLNPGTAGGAFRDVTAARGLDKEDCGAGLTGWFTPGDWNGDGRTDLFYAVGSGLLLLQGADGRFAPLRHGQRFDFSTDGKDQGLTGASCFAPLWDPSRFDLVATGQFRLHWVGERRGSLRDLVPYGNEIWEGTDSMGPLIAEDLNADGNVDLYAGSRLDYRNAIYGNRGYGSFTTPVLHKPDIFSGPAYQHGALGLAAGDANGDGANDLLIAGVDGNLVLIPNAALAERTPKENPTQAEQVLERTKILSVQVSGKVGVLGAVVSLTDSKGRVIGMRVIGTNVATGCRGPDTVNLAVREPGAMRLSVRFSDGHKQEWPVDLTASERCLTLRAARGP